MIARLTLLMIAFALVNPATAHGYDPQDDLARAAAYWASTPACATISVLVDQVAVGANGATGIGCEIRIGDAFLSYSPAQQCQTITHEYGHLLGFGHVAGLADDSVGVMVTFTQPPLCAALNPPAAEPAAYSTPAEIDDYVQRAQQRRARAECTATASMLPRRAQRVRARKTCARKFRLP